MANEVANMTNHNQANQMGQQVSLTADGNQYLTFMLGEESYGVDILRVQEIKGYTAVTRIPNTPPYIKGVLNLRGTIVPIVDLRVKFKMEEIEYTPLTVIIVLEVDGRIMGIIVDAVSDVLNVPTEDIQTTPRFGAEVDVSFLSGIARCSDKLVSLLDVDRMLSVSELDEVACANVQMEVGVTG